ncbi:MAG TPA: CvpA family protein, partial [Flavisolibacter sp.]|nr:CvpA family protein [Flavisolibacter sp.]
MNYIDVLLWVVIVLAIWSGWQKGFIVGAIDLASWVGSVFIAFLGYQSLTRFIDTHIKALGVWTPPLAFILILIFSRILLAAILFRLFPSRHDIHQHAANRVLGLLPGFISGLINAAIIAALLLAFPLSNGISATTRNSHTANVLAGKVEWLDDKLAPVFNGA